MIWWILGGIGVFIGMCRMLLWFYEIGFDRGMYAGRLAVYAAEEHAAESNGKRSGVACACAATTPEAFQAGSCWLCCQYRPRHVPSIGCQLGKLIDMEG